MCVTALLVVLVFVLVLLSLELLFGVGFAIATCFGIDIGHHFIL